MIDCSIIDFTNKICYRDNIESCFEYIKNKFRLDSIKIDKLFVTHPHYDHINGISYLIDSCLLNNDTEIWINFYYSWPDTYYNILLKRLQNCNFRLIEPKSSNSNNIVEILYPEKTIVRTKPIPKEYPEYDIVPQHKVNNASVVYKINLGGNSMIFPGDLEEKGWDRVSTCYPHLRNSTFYCVSHHGSMTGHKRKICPMKRQIENIEKCCETHDKIILMGRDRAFRGIFSPDVLQAFKDRLCRTDLTPNEEEPSFLQLDWQNREIFYSVRSEQVMV